jgi:hypothetical protein
MRTCLLDVPRVNLDSPSTATGVCGACQSVDSCTASWRGDSGIGPLSGWPGSLVTWPRTIWE